MVAWLHLHSADATAGAQRTAMEPERMQCIAESFLSCIARATQPRAPSAFWIRRTGAAGQSGSGAGRVPSPGSSRLCPASHPIPGIGRDPNCNRARMPSRRIAPSIYQGGRGRGRPGGSRSPPSDDAPLPRSLHPLRGSAS